jgi:hypothetical protein
MCTECIKCASRSVVPGEGCVPCMYMGGTAVEQNNRHYQLLFLTKGQRSKCPCVDSRTRQQGVTRCVDEMPPGQEGNSQAGNPRIQRICSNVYGQYAKPISLWDGSDGAVGLRGGCRRNPSSGTPSEIEPASSFKGSPHFDAYTAAIMGKVGASAQGSQSELQSQCIIL